MFAKFVRCFLTVVFCVMFGVVCHAQIAFGSEVGLVVSHTSSVSPLHLHSNEPGSMVSVTGHAKIMSLYAATGLSPGFDIAVVREGERFILPGREEGEVDVAVAIEVRSRGPPEDGRWKGLYRQAAASKVAVFVIETQPAPLARKASGVLVREHSPEDC